MGLVTHPLRTGSQMVWSRDLCLKVTFEPLCSAGGCKHQTPALPWARALVAKSHCGLGASEVLPSFRAGHEHFLMLPPSLSDLNSDK